MSITILLAYVLIVCYFIIERLLRKGKQALSLQADPCDRSSSRLLQSSGLFNLVMVLLAPILNAYQIANCNSANIGWAGVFLMVIGLTIRSMAAIALGQRYTRTLRILEGHQILDQGFYCIIRHPGYLGMALLEIGAGLAVNNALVLFVIVASATLSRLYRIRVEEEMLQTAFGEQYQAYMKKTWRLIPFIF
jgi:protein-S-isoprenylcysteine O-methyltransferase Ste14